MPKCAFLTISNTEGWFIDDDLVHEPLKALGWEIQNVPWDRATDWNIFDVVVIRSPWDYQSRSERFLDVLQAIDCSKARLFNPLDTIEWNINKNYLFDLQSKGIELVPTIKCYGLQSEAIEAAFAKFQVHELVVKPIIGANADDTFRLKKHGAFDINELQKMFEGRECMLQPFMEHIVDEGEFSLIYFNGHFSHALVKTVKKGDFRVQEEHGGGVVPIEEPEKQLVAAADKVMRALPEPPLYARVDLVRTPQASFALMELELIEPCLYFRFSAASAAFFARCLDDCWQRSQDDVYINHSQKTC